MTSLVWLVTARCILSCPHCYAYMYRSDRELSKTEKLILAEQVGRAKIGHICITGGEPFLLEELEEIVRILRNYDIDTTVFTSGVIVDEHRIRTLHKYDVYFYVSVDGDPQTHNKIRNGTWNKLESFLNILKNDGIPFGTCMAISRLNYDKTGSYVETVIKYDPDAICVIPVMPSGRALENEIYVEIPHLKTALALLEDKCKEYGVKVRVWCLPCLRAYTSSPNLISGSCRSWDVIDISPGGRLLICDILNIEVCSWSIGKKFEDLVEYYKSSELYKRSRKIPDECLQCMFVNVCRGGCFSRSYIKYSIFEKKDPLCPL
ncbi:MAG: radical SAM protein [Crenarchaeota archaeon]|nr:radical SAM protein [Thermoproteota archaeon]